MCFQKVEDKANGTEDLIDTQLAKSSNDGKNGEEFNDAVNLDKAT